MDKELIERIALEVAEKVGAVAMCKDPIAFTKLVIERIDAERGKEAVAWRFVDDEDGGHVSFQKSPPTKEQIEYLARWNRPKWEPLFLSAPTIPEGMVMVDKKLLSTTIKLTKEASETEFNRQPLSDELYGVSLMLAAAQGERK